jgi:hypothetical protein
MPPTVTPVSGEYDLFRRMAEPAVCAFASRMAMQLHDSVRTLYKS